MADEKIEKRPFKICKSSREGKKGIVCSSLEELKNIARERFSIVTDCRVFLESDGTEVDNEEYFQFLPPQTFFMVTDSNEQWAKSASDVPNAERKINSDGERQECYHGYDEIDGPSLLSVVLKKRILEDPMFFISLSTDELYRIVDLGLEKLQNELYTTTSHTQLILDSCEQELSRRTDIKQTHELLNICRKAIDQVKRENDNGHPESKKLKT